MDLKKRKLSETAENGLSSEAGLVVTEEDIAALLDPLSREQLLQLTLKAAVSHPDVLSEVRKLADGEPASRKLFVRGLSWTTSAETLRTEFSRYGAVEEVVVITDKSTGKSKGFGFVTFKHRDAAIRALKEPSKKIEGRMTVCHLSSGAPREASHGILQQSAAAAMSVPAPAHTQVSNAISCRKIYVGNLPKNTHGDTLLEFFSQYGEVEEGPLGFDRETGKCKGFALFIYKSAESAEKCLAEPSKKFNGNQINCKLAESSSHKTKDESAYNNKKSNNSNSTLALGYDLTSSAALANAYTPSSLGQSSYGQPSLYGQSPYGQSSLYNKVAPGVLSSYGMLDPLSSRDTSSSSMLLGGADTMYGSGSMASLYGLPGMRSHASLGLPMSSHSSLLSASSQNSLLQTSRVHPSWGPNNAQDLPYPSLPRSSYY